MRLEKTTRLFAAIALVLAACAEHAPRDSALGSAREAAIDDHWVGTWAASPQGDGTTFSDKTLRQIVRTSVGGASVRVRLSNVYGTQPLTIDNVHVAERSNGSSIALASDHALKFAGQASITIAAGQVAVSDATAFDVKPLSDLAVSFYLQNTAGTTTAHGTGLQDNYVASGNVAANESLNGAQVKGSYYFLTNVDVQNASAWGAVVTLGASITDGVASGGNNNRRWPNDLAKRLNDAKIPVSVLNQGISGNRLLADGSGDSALKRFERDVLSQTGVRWVIFSDDPINDLGSGNPTSTQLIDGLKQLVQKAHAANIEFWCSTLTPYQGANYWKAESETVRAAIIAFIKSPESDCDQIVDQDGATHDPAKPTWYLPDFDAGDHLHPNEKGLQAIADAVDVKGFSAPEGSGGGGGVSGGAAGSASDGGSAGTVSGGAGSSALGGAAGSVSGSTAQPAGGNAAAGGTSVAGSSGASTQSAAGATSQGGSPAHRAASPADSGCGCRLGKTRTPSQGLLSLCLALVILAALGQRRRSWS
jgi:lysophospholipase L1-like esterase